MIGGGAEEEAGVDAIDLGGVGAESFSLSALIDGAGVGERAREVVDNCVEAETPAASLLDDGRAPGLEDTMSCSPLVIGIEDTGPSTSGSGFGG